jgi:hypothetical protein
MVCGKSEITSSEEQLSLIIINGLQLCGNVYKNGFNES